MCKWETLSANWMHNAANQSDEIEPMLTFYWRESSRMLVSNCPHSIIIECIQIFVECGCNGSPIKLQKLPPVYANFKLCMAKGIRGISEFHCLPWFPW